MLHPRRRARERDLLRVGADERGRAPRARGRAAEHHARKYDLPTAAGCDVALELGAPDRVVVALGERPEGACVQVGDAIEDGKLGACLVEASSDVTLHR